MRSHRYLCLTLMGLFLMCGPAQSAGVQPAATEPDPVMLLQRMCDYLKSLNQFSWRAEVLDDQVYYGGRKLQYGIEMETYVKRPDKVRVNAEGDKVNKQFFFNGRKITLYDKDEQVYGTLDVPPDIEGALDKANKDFGVRVALTDLASPRLWDHVSKRIEHSLYVGMHKVRGIPCHHLAFDGATVHVQIWIDAGDKPLPRKVVFTQKKVEGSPEWVAILTDWNTSAQLGDSLFNFMVPKGVHKIKFVPVTQSATPGKKKGGKS